MTRLNKFLIFLVVAVWGATICNVLAAHFGPSINIPLVVFGVLMVGVGLVNFKRKKRSSIVSITRP
jgi:LPXTG-motif cell wall-anchored protein